MNFIDLLQGKLKQCCRHSSSRLRGGRGCDSLLADQSTKTPDTSSIWRKRTLNKTNPYLADPAKRRAMFQMTVYTSTDIEGVKLTSSDLSARIIANGARPRHSVDQHTVSSMTPSLAAPRARLAWRLGIFVATSRE